MLNLENTKENESREIADSEPVNEDNTESKNEKEPPSDKKSNKKRRIKITCIVLSVFVVIVGAFLLFGDYILNGFFSLCSPKAHFSYICTKAALDATVNTPDYIEVINEKVLDDKTISGETEFSLESNGLMGLAGSLGFNNIALKAEYDLTKNDTMNALDLNISSSKKRILSIEARADFRRGAATVKIPELSDTALIFNTNEITDTKLPSQEAVIEALPDVQTDKKLIMSYLGTAYSCIDGFKREKDTLSVGEETQKKTKLTMSITTDSLLDISEAVLEKMQKDKKIKKHILEKSDEIAALMIELFPDEAKKYKNISDNDLYNEVMAKIDELLDNIKDKRGYIPNVKQLTVSLWINVRGEIVAVNVKLLKSLDVFLASLGSDNRIFTEASLKFNNNVIASVEGESTEKNNLLEGSYDIKAGKNGFSLEYSNVDVTELKNGNLSGNIRLIDNSSKIEWDLDLSFKDDKLMSDGNISYRSVALCKVRSTAKKEKASDVELHQNCISYKDWEQLFTIDELKERIDKIDFNILFPFSKGFLKP